MIMKTKIHTLICVSVVLGFSCIVFARVVPKLVITPDNQKEHGFKIEVHPAMSIHPHQEMVGFSAECPLKKGEHEFRGMNVLLYDDTHVIAGVPVSVSETNGVAYGSFMISEDQIPLTRFMISYHRRYYPKPSKPDPVYVVDLEAYFEKYKTDHNK